MCKSDAVFLLTKGPEATHLLRRELLITDEHKVKARPESGKTPIVKRVTIKTLDWIKKGEEK